MSSPPFHRRRSACLIRVSRPRLCDAPDPNNNDEVYVVDLVSEVGSGAGPGTAVTQVDDTLFDLTNHANATGSTMQTYGLMIDSMVGVVSYSFSSFEVLPRFQSDIAMSGTYSGYMPPLMSPPPPAPRPPPPNPMPPMPVGCGETCNWAADGDWYAFAEDQARLLKPCTDAQQIDSR